LPLTTRYTSPVGSCAASTNRFGVASASVGITNVSPIRVSVGGPSGSPLSLDPATPVLAPSCVVPGSRERLAGVDGARV